jgi:hypothetical protein
LIYPKAIFFTYTQKEFFLTEKFRENRELVESGELATCPSASNLEKKQASFSRSPYFLID